MTAVAPAPLSLYRVAFYDGRIITLAQTSAPSAEASAKRQHPGGFVRSVKFLRRIPS